MEKDGDIQFFLEEKRSEKEMNDFLSDLFGLVIITINYPVDDYDSVMQVLDSEVGYAQYYSVYWPFEDEYEIKKEVAQKISEHFNVNVLMDVEAEYDSSLYEDCWLLASPGKEPKIVPVCSVGTSIGLVEEKEKSEE